MVYLHKIECYLTIKENKLTNFTGKLMKLETTILSVVTRHRKTNACIPSFVDISFESSDLCVLLEISTEVRKFIRAIGW